VPATGGRALPVILSRKGRLPARHARDGEELLASQVLVAPPDHHLVVLEGRVGLTRGPLENGYRPAVDVLFRSAALAWRARVVAVVLSGSLDDGAAGAAVVTRNGGRCVVQSDALFDGMPRAALRADDPQQQAPAREIPALITAWLEELPEIPARAPTEAESVVTDGGDAQEA
jgi:two-component system chemotaxis response regulator CheB